MANVESSWLTISTCRFPELSDQTESFVLTFHSRFLLAERVALPPFPMGAAEALGVLHFKYG
jgi:hypothetical protein